MKGNNVGELVRIRDYQCIRNRKHFKNQNNLKIKWHQKMAVCSIS